MGLIVGSEGVWRMGERVRDWEDRLASISRRIIDTFLGHATQMAYFASMILRLRDDLEARRMLVYAWHLRLPYPA